MNVTFDLVLVVLFCFDAASQTDRLAISDTPSHTLLGVLTHQTHTLPASACQALNFSHEFHYFHGHKPRLAVPDQSDVMGGPCTV